MLAASPIVASGVCAVVSIPMVKGDGGDDELLDGLVVETRMPHRDLPFGEGVALALNT